MKEQSADKKVKVIADYPLSKMYFKVGDILEWDDEKHYYFLRDERGNHSAKLHKNTVEEYPHLFKKLNGLDESQSAPVLSAKELLVSKYYNLWCNLQNYALGGDALEAMEEYAAQLSKNKPVEYTTEQVQEVINILESISKSTGYKLNKTV